LLRRKAFMCRVSTQITRQVGHRHPASLPLEKTSALTRLLDGRVVDHRRLICQVSRSVAAGPRKVAAP